MSNPKTLVTGSAGFIGRNLVKKLVNLGFEVQELDRSYLDSNNWEETLHNFLSEAKPDVVFHVGACSNTLATDVQSVMEANYESTKVISDWSSATKVPLIFSSSAANYGKDGRFPNNLYAWSKYVAEHYAVSRGAVALRYFNVYGPGEEDKGEMASLLFQAHQKHVLGRPVLLFPGDPTRDFVHIDDVVDANIHAYENIQDIRPGAYDVGSGSSSSFEDMLDFFSIPYGYTGLESIPAGYQFKTQSSAEKWLPGWRPQFSLAQGLRSYRAHLTPKSEGLR